MMDGGFFLWRCGVGSDLFFAGLGNLQLYKTILCLDPVCMIACAFGDPLISTILEIGGFYAIPGVLRDCIVDMNFCRTVERLRIVV